MYDGYPVRLRGMPGVSRARVIWNAGRLYVARSVNDVVSVAADEPTRTARGYTTGKYRWHQFGCSSCAARSALAKASTETLMANATPIDQPAAPQPEPASQPAPATDPHPEPVTQESDTLPDVDQPADPTPTVPAGNDRATCPECGKENVKVNRDGTLRKHGCGEDTSPADGD